MARHLDRYTFRTPHFHMYSHFTDHTAQMTCVQRLKDELCAEKNIPSSTRHGSSFAARDTEHFLLSSSRNREVSGKPDAMFSCHSESSYNTFSERLRSNEPGNRFESSVHSALKFADPANVGKSLLDGNKDHLLNLARSELMKQEHQVGSFYSCTDELQQHAYAQRLELQDAHDGYIESRREQLRLQEELSMKEKSLETQMRNTHEMGEMKRAQESQIDTFSLQKLGESHETVQRLTSQLQEVQEQMNSMNDSGEFQEVESDSS